MSHSVVAHLPWPQAYPSDRGTPTPWVTSVDHPGRGADNNLGNNLARFWEAQHIPAPATQVVTLWLRLSSNEITATTDNEYWMASMRIVSALRRAAVVGPFIFALLPLVLGASECVLTPRKPVKVDGALCGTSIAFDLGERMEGAEVVLRD